MSITQIECFVAAYEYKSYSEAAKSMYKTSAAIAKQVHSLEQDLDQTLFNQSGGILQATDYAKRTYIQACKALTEYRKVFTLDAEKLAENVKTIKLAIAAQPYRGNVLPPYLKQVFEREFPQVKLQVFAFPNSECEMAVSQKLVDAALAIPFEGSDLIRVKDIYRFMPSILCSPRHRFSKVESVSIKDLEDERVAMPIDIGTFYPKLKATLDEDKVNITLKETGYNLESHQEFIESGGLIFIKPDPRLKALYSDALYITISDRRLESSISLITDNPGSPKTRILASFASSLSDEIAKRKQLKVGSH